MCEAYGLESILFSLGWHGIIYLNGHDNVCSCFRLSSFMLLKKQDQNQGANFALSFPDEYTLEHPWKEEKKPRSYNFDACLTAASTQVYASCIPTCISLDSTQSYTSKNL